MGQNFSWIEYGFDRQIVRRQRAGSLWTVPSCERFWNDFEPGTDANIGFQCQNDWLLFFVMVIYFEKKMERLTSGDYKIVFGTNLRNLSIGLMKCGRAKWQEAEVSRKDFNIVLVRTRNSLSPTSSRSLRTQSHWPSLQDNVFIPDNFFEYIYHIGCAINIHSITNSGLITGGQNLGKERQTVFFTAVNPTDKEHKDPYKLDLAAPRLAWYKKNVEKDTKTWCIGSMWNLLNGKDWSSIKQDRKQSSFSTHSQLIVSRKFLWWNLEKTYTRKYMCHFGLLQRFP